MPETVELTYQDTGEENRAESALIEPENITTESRPEVRRIPGGRGGMLTPFTPETSRLAKQAARDKLARAVKNGVADYGTQLPGIERRDPYAVIRAISENHAAQAYNAGERGSASSFRLILDTGWPDPGKEQVQGPAAPDTSGVDTEELKQMLAAWRAHKAANGVE